MKFRFSHKPPLLPYPHNLHHHHHHQRRFLTSSFFKKVHHHQRPPHTGTASFNGGTADSKGSWYLVPGATAATLLMLGALHARRMYNDKKIEEAREKGIDFEFQPDVKAAFLRLLPLRTISRFWGFLTSVEVPVFLRPHLCRAWARAFHSNLEEAALPLEEYASLRELFTRSLKEGSRPIDPDPKCLVSPVDGTVLGFGELKGPGAMIEQVKGFSYSIYALLGANSFLPMIASERVREEDDEVENTPKDESRKSWWRVSLASPKVRNPVSARPMKGLFYCVIYLKPGDYHRIHSPADWSVLIRRHFSGHLFPMNERATRTIKNLYVENERVVLEGLWQEGFMAIAAVGATNIGSIELFIEPELWTNRPMKKLFQLDPPEERLYDPEGGGIMLKKGDEHEALPCKCRNIKFQLELTAESPGISILCLVELELLYLTWDRLWCSSFRLQYRIHPAAAMDHPASVFASIKATESE